jgi:hypothetical protein
MGAGVQHLFPDHPPNVPAPSQGGNNGGMHTTAHEDHLQPLPYAPDQAPAPASRVPREP